MLSRSFPLSCPKLNRYTGNTRITGFSIVTLLDAFILFIAGLLSGIVNAIAGGGTFLTFGALTLVGMPPIVANATSSIAQLPGYITSTLAYWKDISRMWRGAITFAIISVIGASIGSLILLALDNQSFAKLVPWLLIAATALFAAGPWLRPTATQDPPEGAKPSLAGSIVQFFTAVYGGFFGAGMGVMMLATLGLTEGGGYHRLNALKNMLSIIIASVAIVIFVSGGIIAWLQAAAMVPGVAVGGYAGVWTARRVPQSIVRGIVIAVGLLLAGYYFVKG
jgi:uncharacterized membrane protein YfcA